MADNTTIDIGTTGDVISTEDRGGVKWQRILIDSNDGPSIDAFGRWRVSNPETLFDSKLLGSDSAPLVWDENLDSGTMATTTPTEAKPYIDWTSNNITAGKRTRQTFRRFNYQPGKSQIIIIAGVLELASGTKTGCERRTGYFDDNNGAFFESDAGTIGVTTRSNDSGSPIDITVTQANWNIDTMDGGDDSDNPSGITADWSKGQIFVIDFQWLSLGRVRFGLEIGGMLHYVHQVVGAANSLIIPWCSNPCLPIRHQIITTTSSGVCSMRIICSTVISEGTTDDVGIIRYHSTAGTGVTTDNENEIFAVVGIRLKSTHVGTTIKLLDVHIQVHTASEFLEWLLIWNGTVAGTFTYTNLTNSAVQVATGATTNSVTSGTIIGGGYVQSAQRGGGDVVEELNNALMLGVDTAGTTLDTLVLAVRPIGGVDTATVEGSMTWRELT